MYFSRDVLENIPRGSLPIEEEPQECRVIQADDHLLQDIKTKRYFHAQRHELEYVTIPEPEGTKVTYVLKQQGKATLSYQIHVFTIILLLILNFVIAAPKNSITIEGSGWSKTGAMHQPRDSHTASVLTNGKVLITGGDNHSDILNSAELYNPLTKTWAITSSMNDARVYHIAFVLKNGKVLVVGDSCELYDPSTETWVRTGNMKYARFLFTASVLLNGKILVTGGVDQYLNALNSTELYDPLTETWTSTGSMNHRRWEHTASVLTNGKVLITGGAKLYEHQYMEPLNTAELYDPLTGTWAITGNISDARYSHTGIVLENGKVLIAGGDNGINSLRSAELYDSLTGTWKMTSSMNESRYRHAASVLTNGKVLVTGGASYANDIHHSTELYDPSTENWTMIGNMNDARQFHTASVLLDGRVLVTGGENDNGWLLDSAELY